MRPISNGASVQCTKYIARLESNVASLVNQALFPVEGSASLIFDDACLKKVAFFLQIDHLGHPWEGVFFLAEQRLNADLLAAAIGDEAQIRLEHRCVQAKHATRHGVLSVSIFKVYSRFEEFSNLFAELRRPQMRVLKFDGVDQVDAEIAVHGFVAKNVHVLLGGA